MEKISCKDCGNEKAKKETKEKEDEFYEKFRKSVEEIKRKDELFKTFSYFGI